MTPVSGLMNMTRSGDIDPFITLELYEKYKKYFSFLEDEDSQFNKFKKEIYEESGLYIFTGHKDMRDVLEDLNLKAQDQKRINAEFAIEVYLNKIVKEVGSAFALLGGVEKLVLTGSILEKSVIIRDRLLEKLVWLKLKKKDILVLKTEEELQMVSILLQNQSLMG